MFRLFMRWCMRRQSARRGTHKSASRNAHRSRLRRRLHLERLEDRTVPAGVGGGGATPNLIVTVNSAGDDPLGPTAGIVTLRDAISAVNSDASDNFSAPDVINFDIAGTPSITLTADLPALTNPVFIDGSTQTGVTVNGNGFAMLAVDSKAILGTVTFSGGGASLGASGFLQVNADASLSVAGAFQASDNSELDNYGTFVASGDWTGGSNVAVLLYGTSSTTIDGDFDLGNGSYLYDGNSSTDACTLSVGGSSTIDDFVYINGASSMQVTGDCTINFYQFGVIGAAAIVDAGVAGGTVNLGGFLYVGLTDTDTASLTVGGTLTTADFLYTYGKSSISVTGDFNIGSYLYNGLASTDAATIAVGGNFSTGSTIYQYGASAMNIAGNCTVGDFFQNGVYSTDAPSLTVGGDFIGNNGFEQDYNSVTHVAGNFSVVGNSAPATVSNYENSVLLVQGNFTVTGDAGGDGCVVSNGFASTDSAVFTVGGSFSLDANSQLDTIGNSPLSVVGNFTMGSNSYFEDAGSMAVSGVFDPGGGSLSQNNTIGGVFTAMPGSAVTTNTSTWEVLAGGILELKDRSTLTLPTGGSLIVDLGGTLLVDNGGVLQQAGGILQNADANFVYWTWTGHGGDGNWDNSANWNATPSPDWVGGSTNAYPGQGAITGELDFVTIDTGASAATITVQAPDNLAVRALATAANDTLAITGGTLLVTGNSTLQGPLSMSGGTLAAQGAKVTLTATGATIVTGASLSASNGATLSLPKLTSYANAAASTPTSFTANGAGSLLSLPALGTLGTLNSTWTINATNGGDVNLSALTLDNSNPNIVQNVQTGGVISTPGSVDVSSSGLTIASGTYTGTTYHVLPGLGLTVSGGSSGAIFNLDPGERKLHHLWRNVQRLHVQSRRRRNGERTGRDIHRHHDLERRAGGDGDGGLVPNRLRRLDRFRRRRRADRQWPSVHRTWRTDGGLPRRHAGLGQRPDGCRPGRPDQPGHDDRQRRHFEKDFYNDGVFDNFGTIIQTGTGNLELGTDGAFPATLKNEAGASYLIEGNGGLGEISDSGFATGQTSLDNAGLIRKTAGGNTSNISVLGAINNTGTIEADSGTIALSATLGIDQLAGNTLTGGVWNALNGATLQFPTGSNITANQANLGLGGAGATVAGMAGLASNGGSFSLTAGANFTTAGDFANSGSLTVGAGSTLNVSGNFTQTPSGTLNEQIGGTPGSGHFGKVAVTQNASLAGAFNLALVNSFGPSSGQDFPVLTYAGATGAFSTFTGLAPFFTETQGAGSLDLIDSSTNPVDLRLSNVTAPTAVTTGGPLTVNWTVSNPGGQAASGNWQDSVYLSLTPTITASSILLGATTHTGGLPAGQSYNGTFSGTVPALTPGFYFVIVQADSLYQVADPNRANNTASATTGQVNISVPALTLGTPQVDSFTAANQDHYYQVTVPSGGTLQVSLSSNAGSGATALYVSQGVLPTLFSFQESANVANQPNQTAIVPQVLTGGTYYILAHSVAGAAASAGFTQTAAQTSGISITRVSTSTGGNAGNVTIEIDGTNFSPSATANLTLNSTIINAQVNFVSASQIFATFNLSGATPAGYALQVKQGGQTATAPQTFQVTAAQSSNGLLFITLSTPQLIRSNRTGIITVTYTNQTANDIVAPVLSIQSTNANVFFSVPSDPNNFVQTAQVLAVAESGPAGVLRPGQSGQFNLILLNNDTVSGAALPVSVLQDTPGQTIDWASRKTALQPATFSVAAWNVVWANLMTTVGTTTDSYNAVLAQAATYLGQLGDSTVKISDISRLWSFLVAQANNAFPTATLASAVDVSLPTPGTVSLSINRTFVSPIAGRYAQSIFGLGWTTSLQTVLTTDSLGNVTITTGGAVSYFSIQANRHLPRHRRRKRRFDSLRRRLHVHRYLGHAARLPAQRLLEFYRGHRRQPRHAALQRSEPTGPVGLFQPSQPVRDAADLDLDLQRPGIRESSGRRQRQHLALHL